MKILDVISVYYYQFEIETDGEGTQFYRRDILADDWERLWDNGWEEVTFDVELDKLEKLYQEWIKHT